ncbi:MAG: tetratricopeptide repeat protein, partial [Muribaculaceae bacterium]|nr:tetratricopeptide repeat protein [Muribaculaceae bacterium]
VYTENQPDFTWLMPYEEKEFTQYFLPYRELGVVKNATKDLLMNIDPVDGGKVHIKVFATSAQSVLIRLTGDDGHEYLSREIEVTPERIFEETVDVGGAAFDELTLDFVKGGRSVMTWHAEPDEIRPVPDAAEAALLPSEIKTVEQLFLSGLHLEQYRHATYSPLDYYEEGLRRDPDDVRCNNAVGLWYIRKGRFDLAETYLRKAVKVLQKRNPNPYDGEPIYNLGLALRYQYRYDEAYDRFYKSTWNGAWQDAGYFACAQISCMQGRYEEALYEVGRSLLRNWHNAKARALKAAILRRLGREKEAVALCEESLGFDKFNYGCLFVGYLVTGDKETLAALVSLMRGCAHNYDEIALDFCAAGLWSEAESLWRIALDEGASTAMTNYYLGWALMQAGDFSGAGKEFAAGAEADPDFVFPNRPEAILALRCAIEANPEDANANHFLGNLYYDKRQYDFARKYWERAACLNPSFPTTWRNLALLYYNKSADAAKALECMERAFSLDESDSRVLMELDQLYKKLQRPHAERLAFLQKYPGLIAQRDDLVLEEITLLNQTGRFAEAMALLDGHTFHPWEGGEGKVPMQYQTSRVELAKEAIAAADYDKAIALLEQCLEYPRHLGEGKLYGAQENDFFYLLGLCHQAKGDADKARRCFSQATLGPTEPAAAMYYNDAKPDKIYYAGLAYRALGDEKTARSYFNRLVDYGKQHLHENVRMDYFAVSLPDLQVWDGCLDEMNRIHCLYMLALGYAGLGDKAHSDRYLTEAEAMNVNHQGLQAFRTMDKVSKN